MKHDYSNAPHVAISASPVAWLQRTISKLPPCRQRRRKGVLIRFRLKNHRGMTNAAMQKFSRDWQRMLLRADPAKQERMREEIEKRMEEASAHG